MHYLLTLAIYFMIFAIQAWGLNLQFGLTGILDFTYITFVAIGAYFAGVAAMTPSTNGGMGGSYILGWHLPFPLSPVIGGLAAAMLGVIVGIIGLRRLRSDYLAIVTVSVGQIVWMVIGNATPLFNGWDGIVGVPQPYNSVMNLSTNNYELPFLVISVIVAALIFWLMRSLTESPYGRILRAIREDENVAAALGKNVFRYRMSAFVIGAFIAGISGALQIEYIGAWNPSGWTTLETFIVWAAMLVGGRGNNRGMLLGAFLVPVLFSEATRLITIPGHPLLIQAIRGMAIGLLMILAVRFRPQGAIPERKRVFELSAIPGLKEDVANGHTAQG
ncbi:branched-chain amino acid ABC transporter permease [Alicyclobacillus sp. ALC3]|uniref:branched-chain amino acid ABC transporter permease n=1 Tax=Alicyclobacillus sp. ALC3 TaxID=2796143 RepID=UPI00237892E2|nr:branched-chain amino acid ABC transporter permease [Alicyclobacillus sp. ALC3]WDL96036.1 branched-chain amino acid ABC transporter permease [Alicyclobacillus sp. ALC3]